MSEHRGVGIRVAAVAGPIVVAAATALLRGRIVDTGAALVLVLAVVGVGILGDRVAGLLAAVSAAVSFDFFLTAPYYRFAIVDRDDLEVAILLLAVGVAVTEIGQWGRRHEARSKRAGGYLDDVARVARMAADGTPIDELVTTVEGLLIDVLEVDAARFEAAAPDGSADRPVLHRDGIVRWDGQVVDVARHGLPTMDVIELPAGRGVHDGRFLMTASWTLRSPDLERRLVAVTLAEQVRAPTGVPGSGHVEDRMS